MSAELLPVRASTPVFLFPLHAHDAQMFSGTDCQLISVKCQIIELSPQSSPSPFFSKFPTHALKGWCINVMYKHALCRKNCWKEMLRTAPDIEPTSLFSSFACKSLSYSNLVVGWQLYDLVEKHCHNHVLSCCINSLIIKRNHLHLFSWPTNYYFMSLSLTTINFTSHHTSTHQEPSNICSHLLSSLATFKN